MHWASGEPSSGYEDRISLVSTAAGGEWGFNDAARSDVIGYICEHSIV